MCDRVLHYMNGKVVGSYQDVLVEFKKRVDDPNEAIAEVSE